MEDNKDDQPFNINRDELSTPSMRQIGDKKDIIKIIIITTAIIFVITLLIILIIVASKSKGSKAKEKIGEIRCIFDTTKKTKILSDDFKSQNINIYIDGIQIKYSKEYDFPRNGIHHVHFYIYDELNMDYMFKEIPELLSVEMSSEKKAKITSMIGAFEKAENLVNLKIEGFDTSRVTSMHKHFFGTKFSEINTEGIDSKNVVDMSYMFSNMPN